MLDLDTLKPGQRLLVIAAVQRVDDQTVHATVSGTRPPFTLQNITIGQDDIHAVLEGDEAEPRLPGVGDTVRNALGQTYEVIAEPRELEDGRIQVALFDSEGGMDHDYVSNLEIIPTQPSALRSEGT